MIEINSIVILAWQVMTGTVFAQKTTAEGREGKPSVIRRSCRQTQLS